jgi:hypothetical protein
LVLAQMSSVIFYPSLRITHQRRKQERFQALTVIPHSLTPVQSTPHTVKVDYDLF